jgi:hypothetical protein
VHDQLSRPYGSGVGEALDQTGQRVVRHGQQDQVGEGEDAGGLHDGDVGQELRGTAPGGVGDRGDGDGAMSGEPEGGGEGGAHAAGADDSDGEPGGSVLGSGLWRC